MCDKIRQLQAETRKEERARAAQREKMLKKEVAVAKMEAEKANRIAEEQRKREGKGKAGSGTCQAGCRTGKKQLSAWDGRSQDPSRKHQHYSAYECGYCQKAGIVAWVCALILQKMQ